MILTQCKPFTQCWCATRPTHPNCNTVNTPIDGQLIILLLAGILLGIYLIKKLNK